MVRYSHVLSQSVLQHSQASSQPHTHYEHTHTRTHAHAPVLHSIGWRVAAWYLLWILIYVPIVSWWSVYMTRKIKDSITREIRVESGSTISSQERLV